jgi:hypothetical protein
MSDNAVKITNLPAVSTLQSTDVIPVVDASATQTMKATLQQVQNLGPGAGTVTETTIAPGAVTAGKNGMSAINRLFYSHSTASQNSSGKFIGTEAEISDYTAINLLKLTSADQWFAAMGVSPNFSGPVTVPFGGVVTTNNVDQLRPSYTFGEYVNVDGVSEFAGDKTTGMFGGDEDSGTVNFACADQHMVSFEKERVIRVLQQPATDSNGLPVADSREEQEKLLLQFIGANAYAVFSPTTSAVAYNSGVNSSVVGTFLGLPASRRASTLIGNIGHGPAIADQGAFGTWNGGNDANGVSQYPQDGNHNGVVATWDGNGSGNRLAMQKRLEIMGYDPNTLGIHNLHNYVSWWDNALLYLSFNATTGKLAYSSQRASYSNRRIIRQIIVSPIPRTENILIHKMRGIASIEQVGSGNAATFTARFTQPYPDTNYKVDIGLSGSGSVAASTSNTITPYHIDRYIDRVEFKIGRSSDVASMTAGLQIAVSTMR